MEVDLAGYGAVILELSISVAVGLVPFVAAVPGEVDAGLGICAIELAIDGTEPDVATTFIIEADEAGPEKVDERAIPEFHLLDAPFASEGMCHAGAPSSLGRRTRL